MSIKQILSNLEYELQQLLSPYQEKINELESENRKLISEIAIIIEEKNRLMEELSLLRNNLV